MFPLLFKRSYGFGNRQNFVYTFTLCVGWHLHAVVFALLKSNISRPTSYAHRYSLSARYSIKTRCIDILRMHSLEVYHSLCSEDPYGKRICHDGV